MGQEVTPGEDGPQPLVDVAAQRGVPEDSQGTGWADAAQLLQEQGFGLAGTMQLVSKEMLATL